jgi:hypothetical protein
MSHADASAELRQQLAWLGYVGVMTAMWIVVLIIGGLATHGATWTLIWGFLVLTPVAGIPLACVVAVLKYRLYEIDRVISRAGPCGMRPGQAAGVPGASGIPVQAICSRSRSRRSTFDLQVLDDQGKRRRAVMAKPIWRTKCSRDRELTAGRDRAGCAPVRP